MMQQIHDIVAIVISTFLWHLNNNNGNFICVFERAIVNLATYRQFTNAAWDWIIPPQKREEKKIKIAWNWLMHKLIQ